MRYARTGVSALLYTGMQVWISLGAWSVPLVPPFIYVMVLI
jgi:hypothetical protein